IAFHPTEPLLAMATGPQRTVEVRSVDTGKVVTTLEHPRGIVGLVAWGDGGRLLATGTGSGLIHVWDVASRRQLAVLEGHTNDVRSLFSNPAGDVLVSTMWDGTTRLWDPFMGRQFLSAPGLALRFGADGRQLAFRHGAQVGIWEAALSGSCRTLVHGPASPNLRTERSQSPGGLAYHPRGHLLASAGPTGVRLWDPRTGRERAHLPSEPAGTVLFHSSGTRLISCGDYGLHCWTLRSDPAAGDDGLPIGPALLLDGTRSRPQGACCWGPGERSLAVVGNYGENLVVRPFEVPGKVVGFKG